jgi:hypothetical protein
MTGPERLAFLAAPVDRAGKSHRSLGSGWWSGRAWTTDELQTRLQQGRILPARGPEAGVDAWNTRVKKRSVR